MLIVSVLLVYPLLDRNDFNVSSLADTGVYVLLALGLNIVIGYAGLLDLGYAAFFAIGSYTYALLASPQYGLHLSFWVLLLLATAIAAAFGAILGAPTLRLRGDYLAIVTLGFGEIVPTFFLNAEKITGGTNGISAVDHPILGIPGTNVGFNFAFDPRPYYYLVLLMVLIAIPVIRRLRDSRLGRAWMALREDELAASAMGIDTTRTKLLAFSMGAAFSGFAGCVYASKLGFIGPDQFRFEVSVFVLCMIILGGMGNIWGVIVGASTLYLLQTFVLTQLPTWLRALGEQSHIEFLTKTDFSGLRYLFYGVALVVMMLVRPEGLIPNARRRAELRPGSAELARRESQQELYDARHTDQQEAETRGGAG
ncbi:MAG TPA: branched-chain amino acid ABC transporter permease [Chloroflexia bacterium]|nr:branched-chain amino acid ABC transporter permease [Chloroflexia bacterium]